MAETILIFRTGSLGDTVVALPCFHRIAQSFPDARRILLTNQVVGSKDAPVQDVLMNSGLVHETISFPVQERGLKDLLALRGRIRQTGARTLVYVADRHHFANAVRNTWRDVMFFRFCGIRKFFGTATAREFRKLKVDPVSGETEREAERLARGLAVLGPIDVQDPAAWDLALQPEEMGKARGALAPLQGGAFMALHVGGKVPAKDWGDDNWRALLRLLADVFGDRSLVFFGAGDEATRADAMASVWPGGTLNLCGKLAPRETAAAMSLAQVFIGHDSGPMHLASAVGIPCVAMLGNYNMPKWWHPIGAQHRILHDMRGLGHITPDQVFGAVQSVLNETRLPQARVAG